MLAVAYFEFLYLSRDRLTLGLILGVPILQILLFGYAVRPLPSHVPIAIATGAPDEIGSLRKDQTFQIVAEGLTSSQLRQQVQSGQAILGLEFPPSQGIPQLTVLVNDLDPALSAPALGALQARYYQELLGSENAPRVERLFNPEQRGDWAMTPALSGVVVMISMLMLGCFTLVREREQGTWETLLSSPVTAPEALLGKLLPYLLFGLLQAGGVLLVGRLLFQLPMRGSMLGMVAFACLFAAAHLVVGFAISARAQSQVQAMQAAVFFYLPCMLLSGFLMPFSNMPLWAQRLGNCLPLTHYVRVSRAVLLGGQSAGWILHQSIPLAGFTLLAIVLALWAYRGRS